ncbi:MAG: hypothetical protein C4325_05055 [Blastocatellia bacterium]
MGAWLISTSRTGPHTRDWHSAGVAKRTAAGFPAASAASRLTPWNGQGGVRVQIGSTPRWSAVTAISRAQARSSGAKT